MSSDVNKKILDATLEIIAKEKISGTRMHLIAKEAGMGQSNLHYYYPTKNELLLALLDDLQEKFSEKRTRSVDLRTKSIEENIQGLFEEKKDTILNNKKIDYAQFDYWVQGTVNSEIRSKFEESYNIWRDNISEVLKKSKTGDSVSEKDLEVLPYLIVSIMMGASMQYLIDEGKFDLDEYFDVARKMILCFLDK
jgi:TetR/AcrR family transcriptional regulator